MKNRVFLKVASRSCGNPNLQHLDAEDAEVDPEWDFRVYAEVVQLGKDIELDVGR